MHECSQWKGRRHDVKVLSKFKCVLCMRTKFNNSSLYKDIIKIKKIISCLIKTHTPTFFALILQCYFYQTFSSPFSFSNLFFRFFLLQFFLPPHLHPPQHHICFLSYCGFLSHDIFDIVLYYRRSKMNQIYVSYFT